MKNFDNIIYQAKDWEQFAGDCNNNWRIVIGIAGELVALAEATNQELDKLHEQLAKVKQELAEVKQELAQMQSTLNS
ncbi:MAG: hypothetical protein HC840_01300 [Leptolyngbyaceae cyanobacterium RM2_2_4]|nr:hypothetical protein [Leptolyngbyaceae cyanobacterium RM2_2_4]